MAWTWTFLPDETWEEIFLRLDAEADLARASATCSSFRRIIIERRSLRRFGCLHSPPVIGFINRAGYGRHGFLPVAPPHRSATEARALVHAADFTFSFLPDPEAWRSRHTRDGRVLLSRRSNSDTTAIEDFVVCDPLHRRYVMIPRIPDDLLAASDSTPKASHLLPVLVPAPAPAGQNDEEESFRVVCPVYHRGSGKVMAFVFSSCNQTWQAITSSIHLPNEFIRFKSYYAHGCLYWMFCGEANYSLMLDTREMEFFIIDLPSYKPCAIVEAEEGRLWFLNIVDGIIHLYRNSWQTNGVGAQDWLDNKLIPLPEELQIPLPEESGVNYYWEIDGTEGRYLALASYHVICRESPSISEYFILDIKTLLVEKLCTSNNGAIYGLPYARFPPPLALPSI